MTLRLVAPLGLFLACTPPESAGLQGHVLDHWGAAVPEAVIIVQGSNQRTESDGTGRFVLPPLEAGEHTLKVGARGYIHTYHSFDPADSGALTVSLYEKPEENGFYLVGPDGYLPALQAQPVERMGNDLDAVQGLRREPGATIEAYDLEVIFHTDLTYAQLKQLHLELHRLEFQEEVMLPGPFGQNPVEANMWIATGEVDLEVEPLRSRQDFRLRAAALEPGDYAFTTQDLLEPDEGPDLDAVPEEVRLAFPFTVR